MYTTCHRKRCYWSALSGWVALVIVFALLVAQTASVHGQAGVEWPEVELRPYLTGLQSPVHLTHAGDGSGRLFVVEQRGRIRIVRDGVLEAEPFLDIVERVSCCGERGLLSLAFPPDYTSVGDFFVNYTDLAGNTVVSRFSVTEDTDVADAASEQVVITVPQPYANHNGGQLAFGPRDGYLYVGMGDGGSAGDPQGYGQNPGSLLGKMLRIDVSSQEQPYAIPADNPFARDPAYLAEIWSLGLRNPWRFSFDRASGDMYIGDVGQGQLEEIDFQPASSDGGENYGWNTMEGSLCYLSPGCDTEGLVLPVAEYDHSQGCSVTGGVVYRGANYPRMQGMYIYGDYCSGRVWGLKYDGDAWESNLLLDTSHRIVSFGEDEAGDVYLIDYEGDVFLLTDTVRVEPTATSVPTASATPTETLVATDTPTATPTPSRTPPMPKVLFLPVILKQWQGTSSTG